MSHYDYLTENLYPFLREAGCEDVDYAGGLIAAHGDKSYGYFFMCEAVGIPKEHCAAMHLMTYLRPFAREVRDTPDGFVNVGEWIIENYHRFRDILPPVEA